MSDDFSPDIEKLKVELTSEATKRLALLTAIVEAFPDAIVVVTNDARIVLVNNQLELMFGYHRSELLDRDIEILLPLNLRDTHIRHRQGYANEPRTRVMGAGLDLRGRRKTGIEFAIQIMLSPLVTPEGIYTIAVVRRKV